MIEALAEDFIAEVEAARSRGDCCFEVHYERSFKEHAQKYRLAINECRAAASAYAVLVQRMNACHVAQDGAGYLTHRYKLEAVLHEIRTRSPRPVDASAALPAVDRPDISQANSSSSTKKSGSVKAGRCDGEKKGSEPIINFKQTKERKEIYEQKARDMGYEKSSWLRMLADRACGLKGAGRLPYKRVDRTPLIRTIIDQAACALEKSSRYYHNTLGGALAPSISIPPDLLDEWAAYAGETRTFLLKLRNRMKLEFTQDTPADSARSVAVQIATLFAADNAHKSLAKVANAKCGIPPRDLPLWFLHIAAVRKCRDCLVDFAISLSPNQSEEI